MYSNVIHSTVHNYETCRNMQSYRPFALQYWLQNLCDRHIAKQFKVEIRWFGTSLIIAFRSPSEAILLDILRTHQSRQACDIDADVVLAINRKVTKHYYNANSKRLIWTVSVMNSCHIVDDFCMTTYTG